MKHWGVFISMGLFAAGCTGNPVAPGQESQNPDPAASVADQSKSYLVVYQPNTVGVNALTTSLEQRHAIFAVRYRYEQAIQGFAATLAPNQVRALRADPRVQFVEVDGVVTTTTTQAPTPSWGLDRIDQQNLPFNTSYTFTQNGAGVRFYGIDTGILYSHPDFGGRASAGFDAVTSGGGAVDCNGHGSHTASTAAGSTYGVAKGMTIIGVRVLGCTGSGTTSGVVAGIDWVRANAIKPAVANMSLGGGESAALNTAVANAVAAGIVFTVSAGNSNADACSASPASAPSALTVGATTTTDARSSFSNFGTCVDLFAPGSSITAAYITGTGQPTTAVLSGTSMSAPHVAGVAGLYLQQNPSATPAAVATALVNNATNNKVTNPGTGSPNKLLYMGFLNGAPPPVNQPPTAAFTSTCTGLSCAFNGTGSTDDVGVTSYSWNFGDGSTGSGATPSHSYAAAGTYSVTLTVSDAGALTNSVSHPVTATSGGANQPPVAVAVVTCVPGRVCTLDGRGSTDDQGVTSYLWRTASGKVGSTLAVFTMTFDASAGTRTWSLTVTDAAGLTDTKPVTFTVIR